MLLLNNDLLQQFEDYVIELRCENGRRKAADTDTSETPPQPHISSAQEQYESFRTAITTSHP
jgi:hypothetical protein